MKNVETLKRRRRVIAGVTAGALVLGVALVSAQVASNVGQGARIIPGVNGGEPGHPVRPDQKSELAMKIKKPFTVVGVGDLLEFQPFSNNEDPDVQFVVD